MSPFDDYFEYALGEAGIGDYDAESVLLLHRAMEALLDERMTFLTGRGQVVDVTTYLVGRLRDGSVVGVRADTIET